MKMCNICKQRMSTYGIDVIDDYMGLIEFKLSFCWRCGHFGILPNIKNEFTNSILSNPELIYELIRNKQLKPIL